MPRNGDGSGDSGPYDGHEILHGTSGDETLQHTKHVAPMPELEDGEALPGMNASGGAAAPLNDASEEFGATAPRYEQFGDDETSNSTSKSKIAESNDVAKDSSSFSNNATKNSSSSSNNENAGKGSSSSSSNNNAEKGSSSSSSNNNNVEKGSSSSSSNNNNVEKGSSSYSSNNNKSSISSAQQNSTKDSSSNHASHEDHDLENISREKAKRYVNLNEQDVQHAGAGNKGGNDAERSSQRAPRDVGPKEDIELLHGKAGDEGMDNTSGRINKGEVKQGADGNKQDGGSGRGSASGKATGHGSGHGKEGENGSGHGKEGEHRSGHGSGQGSGNGSAGAHGGDHEVDPMRHNAAKFVNIEE